MVSSGQFAGITKELWRRLVNVLALPRRVYGTMYNSPALSRRRQKKSLERLLLQSYSYRPPAGKSAGIKVALIIRDGTTYPKSSAFIRLIGPLTQPSVAGKAWFEIFPENTTRLSGDFSVCIVQR